jgi:DNA polymerase III epsilon subunit-like protein
MPLLRFQPNFKYIVYDTETESTNLHFSRPWQLSFLECEGKRVIKEHDYYIDIDDLNISAGAKRVTNFDWGKYNRKKLPAREVWDKFTPFLFNRDYYMVGHNTLGFDVYQLDSLARYLDLPQDWSFVKNHIDTLALAKAIHLGETPPGTSREDNLIWQYKMLYPKIKARCTLAACAKNYGIEIRADKMHDALEDIRVNQKVFLKQIYECEI